MERWLNLKRESQKKIELLAYALRNDFGNEWWNFTQFVPHNPARQPTSEGYSLEDCFKERGKLEDRKLIIGQVFPSKTVIRMAFLKFPTWADFMVENTPENYLKVAGIFPQIFGYEIEKYPHQITAG